MRTRMDWQNRMLYNSRQHLTEGVRFWRLFILSDEKKGPLYREDVGGYSVDMID